MMRMQDSNTFWTRIGRIQAPSEERLMHMNGMNGCDSWFVIAVSIVYISIQLTSSLGVCIKGSQVSIAIAALAVCTCFWVILSRMQLWPFQDDITMWGKGIPTLSLKMNFPNGILEYVGSAYTRSGAKDPELRGAKDGTGPSAIGQRFTVKQEHERCRIFLCSIHF